MEQAASLRKTLTSLYYLLTIIVELRLLCGTTPQTNRTTIGFLYHCAGLQPASSLFWFSNFQISIKVGVLRVR